jgi:carboxypeptidase D
MIVQLLIFFSIFTHGVTGLQASNFYVRDLPLLPTDASSIRMHAGHLPVNPQHHGALFFWHFANQDVADKSRTVIWLNGGPGCSSLIGAWMEIGPFRFQSENTIVENNGSWHLFTNLPFVDQPVGTGFSYIDTDSFIHELDEMANQFLGFLDRYIEIFPELLQDDIYLAGESFAGQHIPYVAQAILTQRPTMKLRGLLIGNGWIDPVTTYKSYLPFAVANNLVQKDSLLYRQIDGEVKLCQQALANQVHVFEIACNPILRQISYNGAMNNHYPNNEGGRCVNVYDVRLDDTLPDCGINWPPDLKYVKSYLHRQDVMSSIHVDRKISGWTECTDSVTRTFRAEHSKPSIELLPDLLRRIPVVLYSGEYDLICNHLGTENMIDAMTWNNGTGFNLGNGTLAPTDPWIVEDEPAGLIRTARNLTYILFYGASHMVPYNYARRSRVMLHKFMQLDLTSYNDRTTNRPTRRTYKRTAFFVLVAIITVIAITGLVWFFVYKQQHGRIPTPFSIIRTFLSANRNVEGQQRMLYSLLKDSNEDLPVPDNATLV